MSLCASHRYVPARAVWARPSRTMKLIALAVSIFGVQANARGELHPNEVLLLYTNDYHSMAIRNAYIAVHPNVQQLQLTLPYNWDAPHVCNPECAECDNDENCVDPALWCGVCGGGNGWCCSCRDLATVPANDWYLITPDLFESNVRQPILEYIKNLPSSQVPLAIVTMRGLPTGISPSLNPTATHGDLCITSFEGELAKIGLGPPIGQPGFGSFASYTHTLNMTFRDFVDQPGMCRGLGLRGKLFLVSRLDSWDVNADGNYVPEITDLINRTVELGVNKYGVTLVFDEAPLLPLATVAAAKYMADRGWCVFREASSSFLHGPNPTTCGIFDPMLEGLYGEYPELVHVSWGTIVNNFSDPVCYDYVKSYKPHPAGFFHSEESYNGISLRRPYTYQGNQGQVLEWIGAGGSFAVARLNGSDNLDMSHAIANFYEHRLSWGEAVWTSITPGFVLTPLGDPLARIKVYDADVNGDGMVNIQDLLAVLYAFGACGDFDCPYDVNQDSMVDASDIALIQEALDRVCVYEGHEPQDHNWPTSLQPQFFRCGDVNGDSAIDETDCRLVTESIGSGCSLADVNFDGAVTAEDLAIVKQNAGRCFGDVTGDCWVNASDHVAVLAALCFGECDCSNNHDFDYQADVDCDCDVDLDDYAVVYSWPAKRCHSSCFDRLRGLDHGHDDCWTQEPIVQPDNHPHK